MDIKIIQQLIKNYIKLKSMHIVRFTGGLGNQLFQLQLYERLIEIYGHETVYADVSYYKSNSCHSGFELKDKVELNTIDRIPRKKIIIDETTFDNTEYVDKNTYYYDGYWQSEIYFPKQSTCVNEFFNGIAVDLRDEECLNKIKKCYNSTSLHVRRGDYVGNYMHGNIANRTYYQNAINYVNSRYEDVTYFVFSDDIAWCRDNLDYGNRETVYIDWNMDDVCADILLMSTCRINIISNSTFSWWAQYINKNISKLTIAPEYWFNEKTEKPHPDVKGAVHIPNYNDHNECHNPYFSVVIPAYNSEHVIRRCLASVLNQTFERYEVIIVNDGSTDKTKQVIEKYASKDKRVRTIEHQVNESLLAARITGMKEALGEYVVFVDSDDYVDEKTLETLWNHLSSENADIIEYSYIIEPDRIVVSENREWNSANDILNCFYPETIWNKCYSRQIVKELLRRVDSFYCNMGEDGFFTVVFYSNCRCFRRIEDVLYHYVVIGGMSNNKSIVGVEKHIQSLKNRREELKKYADKYGSISLSGINRIFEQDVLSVGKLCAYSSGTFRAKGECMKWIDKACNTRLYRRYLSSKRGLSDAIKGLSTFSISNLIIVLTSIGAFTIRKIRENLYGNR